MSRYDKYRNLNDLLDDCLHYMAFLDHGDEVDIKYDPRLWIEVINWFDAERGQDPELRADLLDEMLSKEFCVQRTDEEREALLWDAVMGRENLIQIGLRYARHIVMTEHEERLIRNWRESQQADVEDFRAQMRSTGTW